MRGSPWIRARACAFAFAFALAFAGTGAGTGCYDVPKPACGFRCSDTGGCPGSYTCAADGFCHAEGSTVTCPLVDAGPDAGGLWPLIQLLSPNDDAKDVAVEANVTVRFTAPVLGISSTTFTVVGTGEPAPVAAAVTYDVATRTATLDPDLPLRANTHYVAMLGDGISDALGAPIYGKRSWAFRTATDTNGPRLVGIEPMPGASGVPITASIRLTFSEQVQYPNGGFLLASSFGTFPLTPMYVSPTTVELEPPLSASTIYTITITAAVTDLTGNSLVGAPVSSTFQTTSDASVPLVIDTVPAAGSVAPISTPISATFSEHVTGISTTTMQLFTNGTLVPATVTYDPSNLRATLAPTAPLTPGTSYTLSLAPGITDAAGNALAPASWPFTTAP